MDKGRFSVTSLLLNAAVVLIGVGLALLTSVRHATWGPEGPVGAWLLLVPYLVIVAAVTTILIARGIFSWVPGGRWMCFAIWVGLLIAFSVSGYYSMSEAETTYEQFAALAGWLLLAGCFVAVNAAPSTASRTAIIATLGLGGLAGWLQVAVWLSEYFSEQAQLEESRIIGNETLASDATRYIGEFHPAPGPALAPAFARRSDLVLSRIREVNPDSNQISKRSYADIQDIIHAATRIQKGGGDLTPQMERWRSYLKRFKNTGDLVTQIDQALPRPNAR